MTSGVPGPGEWPAPSDPSQGKGQQQPPQQGQWPGQPPQQGQWPGQPPQQGQWPQQPPQQGQWPQQPPQQGQWPQQPHPGQWQQPAQPQWGGQPPQGPVYGVPYGQQQPSPGGTFELASWGRRAGAYMIDSLILTLLSFLLATAFTVLFGGDPFDFATSEVPVDTSDPFWDGTSTTTTSFDGSGWWWLMGAGGLWFVLGLFYGPLLVIFWNGRTIGKKATGIKIVDLQGQPPSAGSAWLRECLGKHVLINCIAGGSCCGIAAIVNYLWPLWDAQSRALQDLMGSTRVVLDR